jgi:hypothetical protein
MSIKISDPVLLAQFTQASERIEVCDPTGRVIGVFLAGHIDVRDEASQLLGTFMPGAPGQLPPGVKSPVSDEEFEEARRSPDSGITLNEFWKKVAGGEWQ